MKRRVRFITLLLTLAAIALTSRDTLAQPVMLTALTPEQQALLAEHVSSPRLQERLESVLGEYGLTLN